MPHGMTGRLLLTTDAVGGVWRYSVDLARGLAERGTDCVLAVLGPAATQAQQEEVAGVPGLRIVQTGLPLDWTAATAADLAAASARLASLAALLGASRILLHAPALLGDATWPVPAVVVAHSCLGTWWRAMRSGPPPDAFAWRIEATAAGLRRAAAVIAPSAAHAAAIRACYGEMDITVVHNGAAASRRCGLVREPAVLAAGRLWDEAKGIDAIDRAAERLPIRIAGPLAGPNGAEIRLHHARHLGVLDALGMARAYASAKVFVSMARYEPFGLSVLEAALAGMRLVLLDTPGFRELWDGAATFVTEGPGLAAALAAALRRALDAAGDGGAQGHARRYTIDAMVAGTRSVLAAAETPARARAKVPA